MQGRIEHLHGELLEFTEMQARRLASLGPAEWMRTSADSLEEAQDREGLTIHAFVGDSLAAWSGEMPFAPESLRGSTAAQFRMGNSTLLHARVSVGSLHVHGLRYVWVSPPVLNRYLSEGFHPALQAPSGLSLIHI